MARSSAAPPGLGCCVDRRPMACAMGFSLAPLRGGPMALSHGLCLAGEGFGFGGDGGGGGGLHQLLAGGAVGGGGAFLAAGFAGLADGAAVGDEEVGPEGPVFFWDQGDEVLFDLDGVGVGGEAETFGESGDVGVDGDADVLVVGVAEDDVGGFAA